MKYSNTQTVIALYGKYATGFITKLSILIKRAESYKSRLQAYNFREQNMLYSIAPKRKHPILGIDDPIHQ